MWLPMLFMVLVSAVDAQHPNLAENTPFTDLEDATPDVARHQQTSHTAVTETELAALPAEDQDGHPVEDAPRSAARKSDIDPVMSSVLDELMFHFELKLHAANSKIFERISDRLDDLTSKQRTLDNTANTLRSAIGGMEDSMKSMENTMIGIVKQQAKMENRMNGLIASLPLKKPLLQIGAQQQSLRRSLADLYDLHDVSQQHLNDVIANQSHISESLRDISSGQFYLNSSLHDLSSKQAKTQESLENVVLQQKSVGEPSSTSKDQHALINRTLAVLSTQQTSLKASLRDIVSHQSSFHEEISSLSANVSSLEKSLREHFIEQEQFQSLVRFNISNRANNSDLNRVLHPIRLVALTGYNIAKNASAQLDILKAMVHNMPRRLGYACDNSTQCLESVPDTECGSDGTCECREGFRRDNGSTIRCSRIRLNDHCTQDSQCLVNNANSTCRNNICACAETFWTDGTTCRLKKNPGESCSLDGDCSSGSFNSSCLGGRCSCAIVMHDGVQYRIHGGASCDEGSVQLRKDGEDSWGYVCDDYWNAEDAKVMCRSLGFSDGKSVCCTKYGGSDRFHMDNVKCLGTETHLMRCPFDGWGVNDCNAREVAGVQCVH